MTNPPCASSPKHWHDSYVGPESLTSQIQQPYHQRSFWHAVVLAFLLTFTLATVGSPGGLGIGEQASIKVERDKNWRITKYSIEKTGGKTAWDWLGLIGVPVTLALLGTWLQSQEQKRASMAATEQRLMAAEENKEETLQRYLDRVSQLLIEKDLIKASKVVCNPVVDSALHVIRARTLSVLRSFSGDGERKASVVFFLVETEVLHNLKVSLAGSHLAEANLNGIDLSGVDLTRANLSGASLGVAKLGGTNFFGANLSGANLFGADLRKANLGEANLIETRLSSVDLAEAYLVGATLKEATLGGAKLVGADLTEVDLSGANLFKADLSNAKLIEVDFSGANLSGANLSGSDLSWAKLIEADLYSVQWDNDTIWPNRLDGAKNIPEALYQRIGL